MMLCPQDQCAIRVISNLRGIQGDCSFLWRDRDCNGWRMLFEPRIIDAFFAQRDLFGTDMRAIGAEVAGNQALPHRRIRPDSLRSPSVTFVTAATGGPRG